MSEITIRLPRMLRVRPRVFDLRPSIGESPRADVLSGLTVALALVPEAVAFAFLAGVPPLVGLYAAFIICLITAVLGGRPGMISAATAATAVLMVTLVRDYGLQYLLAATVVAGLLQIAAGYLRLGNLMRFVSRSVITGFAGATADAFTLFERLEKKIEQYPNQLMRASVELAKDWRTDRYLRHLQAMMIVADTSISLVVTGNGDVLEPENGLAAIGSGGNYALAAARALVDTDMSAEEIARKAMAIAADICIYTNDKVVVETLDAK